MLRLLMLVAFTACGSRTAFHPATVPAPSADPLAVATRVLVERGEAVDTRDDTSGVLATKWTEATSLSTPYRYRWTISLAAGVLTVSSQCQVKLKDGIIGDSSSWKDCEKQPEERNSKALAIANAIASAH